MSAQFLAGIVAAVKPRPYLGTCFLRWLSCGEAKRKRKMGTKDGAVKALQDFQKVLEANPNPATIENLEKSFLTFSQRLQNGASRSSASLTTRETALISRLLAPWGVFPRPVFCCGSGHIPWHRTRYIVCFTFNILPMGLVCCVPTLMTPGSGHNRRLRRRVQDTTGVWTTSRG